MPNNRHILVFVIIMLSLTLPTHIQAEGTSGFRAAFHVDYFSPQQQVYKDLYGSSSFPINVRIGYMFLKQIMIFSGIRYLSSRGETATSTPSYFEESYTTRLTIISIPLGINWYLGSGKYIPFVGLGGYYHSYKETWDSLDVEYKGNKFAFFAQAGIQLSLSSRISLFLQGSYTTLPTGVVTTIAYGINLGGVSVGIGVGFRF